MNELNKVEPPRVSVRLGYKMNLGNFENATVEIELEASALQGEKAGDLVDRVYSLTEQKVIEKFNEMKTELQEAGLGEA